MDAHHITHYAIAALLAVGGISGGAVISHRIDAIPAPHVSHLAYAGLTDEEETALTAALKKLGPHDLTIWCTTPGCADLAEDLQFVAYQAGWPTHYQSVAVYGLPKGVSVAGPKDAAASLAQALSDSAGIRKIDTTKIDPRDATDLSIVLGDK